MIRKTESQSATEMLLLTSAEGENPNDKLATGI